MGIYENHRKELLHPFLKYITFQCNYTTIPLWIYFSSVTFISSCLPPVIVMSRYTVVATNTSYILVTHVLQSPNNQSCFIFKFKCPSVYFICTQSLRGHIPTSDKFFIHKFQIQGSWQVSSKISTNLHRPDSRQDIIIFVGRFDRVFVLK